LFPSKKKHSTNTINENHLVFVEEPDEAAGAPLQSFFRGVDEKCIEDPVQTVNAAQSFSSRDTQETKTNQSAVTLDVQRRIWRPGGWHHTNEENLDNVDLAKLKDDGGNVEHGTVGKLVDIVGLLLQSPSSGEPTGECLAGATEAPHLKSRGHMSHVKSTSNAICVFSPLSIPQSSHQPQFPHATKSQFIRPCRHTNRPAPNVQHQSGARHRLSLPAINHQSCATGKIKRPFQGAAPSGAIAGSQSWDWPLSRHERMERVKMIDDHVSQIDRTELMHENEELLEELEELRSITAKKPLERPWV